MSLNFSPLHCGLFDHRRKFVWLVIFAAGVVLFQTFLSFSLIRSVFYQLHGPSKYSIREIADSLLKFNNKPLSLQINKEKKYLDLLKRFSKKHQYCQGLIETPDVLNKMKEPFDPNYVRNIQRSLQDYHPLVSEEEREFPIAYSIVVYKNIDRFLRLFRSIYRPSNVYCIHVDQKSGDSFLWDVSNLTSQFDNVFLATERLGVVWGTFSVLKADLVCLRTLWNSKVSWKYFINLTGQEFPLKTNKELVRILKAMNGSSDTLIDPCSKGTMMDWLEEECIERTALGFTERWVMKTTLPPHGIYPYKGQLHVIVARDLADFILHDQKALDFQEWLRDGVRLPDELFFASLNSNPHLQISRSNPDPRRFNPSIARFKIWQPSTSPSSSNNKFIDVCRGREIRSICMLSFHELRQMETAREIFANKFIPWIAPVAYDCLEAWLFDRVLREINTDIVDIEEQFYQELFTFRQENISTYNFQSSMKH